MHSDGRTENIERMATTEESEALDKSNASRETTSINSIKVESVKIIKHQLKTAATSYAESRSKQYEKVTRIDLVAKDTIDEVVLAALNSKTELSEKVLRAKLGSI